MDPFALPNQTPMISLFWCTMDEPWIPSERHSNGTTIGQIYTEGIRRDNDLLCSNTLDVSHESRHSRSQLGVMCLDELLDPVEFLSAEATTILHPHGDKPEFGNLLVTLDMHVGWLITVPRIEKESVWTNTQERLA